MESIIESQIKTIKDYFDVFFEDIKFYVATAPGRYGIAFDGTRKGNVFNYIVPPNMYEGDMLYHWLENIKGDIVKAEETILLEGNNEKRVSFIG